MNLIDYEMLNLYNCSITQMNRINGIVTIGIVRYRFLQSLRCKLPYITAVFHFVAKQRKKSSRKLKLSSTIFIGEA
ncbi:hypothetical protein [Treponema pectinovorum]|uniref:hypothetical protein n=1 Tax=Treponema pectinovorum TaxID=164 RepID=UPI0011CB29F2|nr:hypothetical protein [Treponema pectinovorum]